MARTRLSLLFCTGLLVSLPTRTAAAGATEALAEWLDGDAPVGFRIDANELEEGVDFYRRSGLPGATQLVFVTSAASTALLGFDVLTARSWQRAGFDPSAPILGTMAAIDIAAAERAIERGGKAADHLYWRTRLVLQTSDRKRAEATLRKLAGLAPGAGEITPANATLIAGILGAPSARGPAIVRALRGRDAVIAGRDPIFGQLIVVHLRGDVVVVDVVSAYSGASFDWDRDRKALLEVLARKPGRRGLVARLGKGAARRLTQPGTALWLDAQALVAAAHAFDRSRLLRTAPDHRIDPKNVPEPDPLCVDLVGALSRGVFVDLAISTQLRSATGSRPRRLDTRLEWGLRPGLALGAALLTDNDGLIDPELQVEKRGAVAAGAVYLRSLGALGAVPRPKLMQGNLASTLRSLRRCGPHHGAALALFAWPQLAGQLLDEIADIHPEAKTLVESARNTAFAVQRASSRQRDLVAALEQSFAPAADSVIQGYFDTLFGAQKRHKSAKRRYRTWGRGPIRPFRWQKTGLAVFGFGLSPKAVAWYLDSPSPTRSPPAGAFAEISLRPPDLFRQLAQSGSGLIASAASAVLPLAALFPRAHGTLRLDGHILRAAMVWKLK